MSARAHASTKGTPMSANDVTVLEFACAAAARKV